MNIKTSSRSLFFVVTGFLVFVIFSYLYFFVYSKVKFLSSEINSAKKSIFVLDKKRKEFELGKSNLENQSKNLEVLKTAFFSESDFVSLLNVFENVARNAGVRFKASGATLPNSGKTAQILIELRGDFASIAKFLITLDNIRYSGLVNKFSVIPDEDNSKTLIATIDYLLFNFK